MGSPVEPSIGYFQKPFLFARGDEEDRKNKFVYQFFACKLRPADELATSIKGDDLRAIWGPRSLIAFSSFPSPVWCVCWGFLGYRERLKRLNQRRDICLATSLSNSN